MKSVNLIPPEERGGVTSPTRTGPVPYVIVAILAAAVLGVTGVALAKKSVADKESEVAVLKQEEQEAMARAEALRPFAEFRAMQEARTATVTSLAQSRFDWERILRELSMVLPSDVWLVNLTGTVSPAVQVENAAAIPTRGTVEGPALELIGCAAGHDDVAELVAALEDIDGVTRVGIESSELPDLSNDAADTGGGEEETTDECRTRDFITKFSLVAAFDAVPVPAAATPQIPAPALGGQPATSETPPQVPEAQAAASAVTGG